MDTLRTELAAAVAARKAAEGRAAAAAAAEAMLQEQADRSEAYLDQARAKLAEKCRELNGTMRDLPHIDSRLQESQGRCD